MKNAFSKKIQPRGRSTKMAKNSYDDKPQKSHRVKPTPAGRPQKQKKRSNRYQQRNRTPAGILSYSQTVHSAQTGNRASVKSTIRQSSKALSKKESSLIRLNKYIANSGMGSRRSADEVIRQGKIRVNGQVVTKMGSKISPRDSVYYGAQRLTAEHRVYILLNKPKGFITTTADPERRKTVMDLIARAGKERLYPVGRLDRNTTGLLLLTNDGELSKALTHPSHGVSKIYKVVLDKPLTKSDFETLKKGIVLEEGKALIDDLAIISDDRKIIGIALHIGWNRIVHKIFNALGYEVTKLDRTMYANLDKKDLPRGRWRFVTPKEVSRLKKLSSRPNPTRHKRKKLSF